MNQAHQLWQRIKKGVWAYGRWLFTLNIGIKRWLLLLGIGSILIGLSIDSLAQTFLPPTFLQNLTLAFLPPLWRILIPLGLGLAFTLFAIMRIGRALVAPFVRPDQGVFTSLFAHTRRGKGPHIVAIGGGTGMPNLLRGLTVHTHNITAIVTVADDGGSSGRLRRELGVLPPGDFRNNLAALASDEALMTQVLQYRFGSTRTDGERGELQGHAFGNLLLAALTGITGSFDEALLAAERVLALRGRVLPSTLEEVTLTADILLPSGETQHVQGESAIPKAHGHISRLHLEPATVRAYPPAVRAILQADLILMGPGSLYTSILPNLLVPALAEALAHTPAPKVYICNLATQPGETDNYTVADHVATLLQYIPTNSLDFVLANDNLNIPPETGGGQTIYVTPIPHESVRMVTADLVDPAHPWRHDSQKLAQAIVRFLENKKQRGEG